MLVLAGGRGGRAGGCLGVHDERLGWNAPAPSTYRA